METLECKKCGGNKFLFVNSYLCQDRYISTYKCMTVENGHACHGLLMIEGPKSRLQPLEITLEDGERRRL